MSRYGHGIQDSCTCGHGRPSHHPQTGECYRFPCPCSKYNELDNPTCYRCGHPRFQHRPGHSYTLDSTWHGACLEADIETKCGCTHFALEPPLPAIMNGSGTKVLRLVRADKWAPSKAQ